MTIYDSFFPLGLGTNRFQVKGPGDADGIARGVELVKAALESGVSYVDIAQTYSKGAAAEICRRAFQQTDAPYFATVKSSYLSDQTADSALRRVDETFSALGIAHAFSFIIWNISSFTQFQAIMQKGALYEGALRAKESGMVDHICFSTHAAPKEIMKIIEEGVFEGVTLSFSVLNAQIMRPVLNCAERNQIGVVVMNPLGGGLIPQQEEYYSFLRCDDDVSTAQAALRYVYAHPAVKIILSGMSSVLELEENLNALRGTDREFASERVLRVDKKFQAMEGFCTGCHYCDGCPQGINIYELMQAYNTTLFPHPESLYGQTDRQIIENIEICMRLKNTFGFHPALLKNPCVECGLCEKKCTAHLPIIARISELYKRFADSNFSQGAMLDRLRQLIGKKRRLGFYPGGGYTAYVLTLLPKAFPGELFEIFVFDSNPAIWGMNLGKYKVYNPNDILIYEPDLIIISNYVYSNEIYSKLTKQVLGVVPVVKLHTERDVPWVF